MFVQEFSYADMVIELDLATPAEPGPDEMDPLVVHHGNGPVRILDGIYRGFKNSVAPGLGDVFTAFGHAHALCEDPT